MAHIWGQWDYGDKIYKKDLQAIEDKIAKLPTREEVEEFEKLENKTDRAVMAEKKLNAEGNWYFYKTFTADSNLYFNNYCVKNLIDVIKTLITITEISIKDLNYEKEYYNNDILDINKVICNPLSYRSFRWVTGGGLLPARSTFNKDREYFVSKLTQTNSSGQEVTVTTAQLKNPTSLSEQQEFNVYLVNPFTGEDIKASNILNITIKHQPPASIAVTTNPTKMVYNNQDSFDPTGMVVKAYDSSGNLYVTTGTPGGVVPNEQLSYGEDELLAYTNSNKDVNVTVNWDTFGLSTVMSDSVTVQPTNPDHMEIEASDINYNDGDDIDSGHTYSGVMVNSDGTPYKNADYADRVTISVSTSTSKAELNDDSIDYGEFGQETIAFTGIYNRIRYSADVIINVYKTIPDFDSASDEELQDIVQKYHLGKIKREQLNHWVSHHRWVQYKTPFDRWNSFYLHVIGFKEENEAPNYTLVGQEDKRYIIVMVQIDGSELSFYNDLEHQDIVYDWRTCDLRNVLNQDLPTHIPDTLATLFKNFTHFYSSINDGMVPVQDKFSLFSAGEVGHLEDYAGGWASTDGYFIASNPQYSNEHVNFYPEMYDNFLNRRSDALTTLTNDGNSKSLVYKSQRGSYSDTYGYISKTVFRELEGYFMVYGVM